MTVCNKETGTLQVHVSIDIDPRIATEFHTAGSVLLDGKLAELWQIVRGVVLGELGGTAAQLNAEHAGNLELQE